MRTSRNNGIPVLVLVALFSVSGNANPPPRHLKTKLSMPATKRVNQSNFFTKLFDKEWTSATIEFTGPVARDGFRYGVGSTMTVTVDGLKKAEGVFLGRMVTIQKQATHYLFEDYADKKYYMIDAARTKVPTQYASKDIQTVYQTVEQFEDTCVVASMKNYSLALLESHIEGNGKLRSDIESGRIDRIGDATNNFYYLDPKTFGDYEPLLRWYETTYGLTCKTITYGTSETEFSGQAFRKLGENVPVIFEFFIGPDMVTAESQWVDTSKHFGEDRRFWAPRAPGPGRPGAEGHAIVAAKSLLLESGRRKLLIKDGDWEVHPVLWDSQKYFEGRIKSSGMIAHYCENAGKR